MHRMNDLQGHTDPGADLGATLARLSTELERAAMSCAGLQHAMSSLLAKLDHPDLGEEIHMLQDVDRLQQSLEDVSRILAVAAPAGRGRDLDLAAAGQAIRLESLRARLGWGADPDQAAPQRWTSRDGIDWF
ncbi:hypothetical protein [Sinisalibacter lacisalsi]|uniref:Uncharacterized protein n=1 Tax=Sinisalibacter lacisalsi TaxID=1526570 RepID=A0ABQ1QM18_9RHOB|nr:hypothetical protein [Sinisalibacter lacisalsi]GGD31474.1 hypothetical protein GCM10011358_14390 [Sinisalibacter lacisalsi]